MGLFGTGCALYWWVGFVWDSYLYVVTVNGLGWVCCLCLFVLVVVGLLVDDLCWLSVWFGGFCVVYFGSCLFVWIL